MGVCYGCGKSGHQLKDFPTRMAKGRDDKQTPPSGLNSDAPKNNRFYVLQSRGDQESSPDVVTVESSRREKKRKEEKRGDDQSVRRESYVLLRIFAMGLIPKRRKRVRKREKKVVGVFWVGAWCPTPARVPQTLLLSLGAGAPRHSERQGHLSPPVLHRFVRLSSFKGYLYSPLILSTLNYV
uniref:Uncharacterized protein n=1 Tax=Solanum tuberosum TaxID=4113 RepID=M1DQR5_SOLTU